MSSISQDIDIDWGEPRYVTFKLPVAPWRRRLRVLARLVFREQGWRYPLQAWRAAKYASAATVYDLLKYCREQGDDPIQTPTGEIGDEYRCSECLEVFKRERSDEDAMAEANAIHDAALMAQGAAIVCDDCYHEIMGTV